MEDGKEASQGRLGTARGKTLRCKVFGVWRELGQVRV